MCAAIGLLTSEALPQARRNPAGTARQVAEWSEINARLDEAFRVRDIPESEALAAQALELAEAAFGPDHPNTMQSVYAVAGVAIAQNRFEQAIPLFRRMLAARERTLGRDHPDTLQVLHNLGAMYKTLGRFAEAEPMYLRALRGRERRLGLDDRQTLETTNQLGSLYVMQGRASEAEPLIMRAYSGARRMFGEDDPTTRTYANDVGRLYVFLERYGEAEAIFSQLLRANEARLGANHPGILAALSNLAVVRMDLGRYAESEELFVRALRISDRELGRNHFETADLAYSFGSLFARQGRFDRAEGLYQRALEIRQRYPFLSAADTATALATARLKLRRPRRPAIEPARIAVDELRRLRTRLGSDPFSAAQRQREGVVQQHRTWSSFSVFADAAWVNRNARRRPDDTLAAEAFVALQESMVGPTDQAVVRMATRNAASQTGSDLGELVRDREALIDRWTAYDRERAQLHGGSDPRAMASQDRVQAELARIEARLDEIDSRLRTRFPDYFSLVRTEPIGLSSAQTLLAPDEAILLVVPTEFGSHVMAITSTGAQWARSEWTSERVEQSVSTLLRDIRATMAGRDYRYDRQTAFALHAQIVAPVEALLAGKRHVFVVAAGALTSLPFGVLVRERPSGSDADPDALRSTSWFADSHALIQIPSIQSLQMLRRSDRRSAPTIGQSFVGFGDPLLRGESVSRGRGAGQMADPSMLLGRRMQSRGAVADVAMIRRLSRLPGTATELESMRIAFAAPRSSLFLGARATERAFRAMDLRGARVIALATHGLVAGDLASPAEPGLVFTPPAAASEADDGFLTASEVSALRLDADWVILSACDTAAGDGSAGATGLSGLARAFFYAGARNLLASHWPVADEAAPRLTVRTIELMRAGGVSRAEALQRAAREVRNDSAHPAWAHPGVWGPFSLIGDGAR